jgi:hypothetical protein
MSRYVFIQTTFAQLGAGAYRLIAMGETVADTPGNALANGNGPGSPADVVAPNFTTSPDTNLLCPLDASAAAAIGKPLRTFAQLINPGMFGLTFGFGCGKQ